MMFSPSTAIIALIAGILAAVINSAIDSFFLINVRKKYIASFKEIIKKCFLSGFTYGIFLGVIFYAFTYTDVEPVRMILIYSILLPVATLLSNSLLFAYSKLFSQQQETEVTGDK